MKPTRPSWIPIAALIAGSIVGPPAAADQPGAWTHLATVRAGLAAASPLAADFVQSFTPSGFALADEESGVLAMRLASGAGEAECVRWDYEEPFAKGFLLCDRVAWAWNPGEASGRRQTIARADQFGLDLLRLSVDELRRSYDAEIAVADGSRVEVRLEPTASSAPAEILDASIELDSDRRRLLSISYRDVEGNLTRFELGDYRTVADPERIFSPPDGLDWLEE